MKLVPIAHILVPENRQRKVFSASKLRELEESILSVGLLHPVVVRSGKEGGVGEARFPRLVAGERRLRVIEALSERKITFTCNGETVPLGMCPVTLTSDLDPIALKEAELDENLKRADLSWSEECAALNELATLRKTQNPAITRQEIARELSEATNQPVESARKNLARAEFVSKHLDNPKVQASRSLDEAYKTSIRLVQADFEKALRDKVGASSEHELMVGDCVSLFSGLTPSSFDAIITDPPYGMNADAFGAAGPEHTYKDDAESALHIARQIILSSVVVCKPESHLYLFCDIEHFLVLRDFASANGWTPFRTPLVWDKGGASGHNPIPTQAIRRSYECILFAERGGKPAMHMISDVIRGIANVSSSLHPAEKPADLYIRLLARSCKPGDRVIDPCCGTGPVFEAAIRLGLRATGIEIDPEFARIADGRRFGKQEALDAAAI